MIIASGEYDLGPATGRLVLRTFRRGVAQSVGHDLTLEAATWSGRVVASGDPVRAEITGTVDVRSLSVIEGTGGLKALTDKDRRDIDAELRKQLAVDAHPEATFVASSVPSSDGQSQVSGSFTVRGTSAPLVLNVAQASPGRYRVTGTVLQSAHGIKPFSAFLGALKLRDDVEIEIEIALSEAATA